MALFICLWIPRPPGSTHTDTRVPDTERFRSRAARGREDGGPRGFGIDGDIDEEAGLLAARLAVRHQVDDAARRGAPRLPGTAHRGAADRLAVHIVDRKSTRLNSSH